jgi:hypothetical protein
MRRLWFLLPLFLLVGGSAGFDQPPSATKGAAKGAGAKPARKVEKAVEKSAAGPALFEVVLEDRSLVRLALLQQQLQVDTPYGSLKVPAGDIRAIDFAPRPVPDAPRRVAAAIGKLGSEVFADRQAAEKELLALGPVSYHAVVEASRSIDLEVKKRAQAVLEKLEKKFPAEELRRKPHDLIHTPTFTIAGYLHGASLEFKNTYFGAARLKLGDLRSLRSLGLSRDVTVTLDSSRYAAPGAAVWLETNVTVRSGTRLVIRVQGEIDMYPLGGYNGQYMATPRGPKWGGRYPALAPGLVVGRIGTGGKEFAIGEKYEGSPGEAGTLYLRIVTSPWNNASSGAYKVTIRMG